MSDALGPIAELKPLGMPWPTLDPFLFCVHHYDAYPKGNGAMAPAASLEGRQLGQDFAGLNGWRMYHGQTIPGFPAHPHRGFETVTVTRSGYVDHSDSLGAAARYGNGDVQWMTAGAGIVHAEMFPLLDTTADNTAELFQIWLNLPRDRKMVEPYFAMFWANDVPKLDLLDAEGRHTELTVIAGAYAGKTPPKPPPNSWGSEPDGDVAIWSARMAPNASWSLPQARDHRTRRMVYFFRGTSLTVQSGESPWYAPPGSPGSRRLDRHTAAVLRDGSPVTLTAGDSAVDVLVLQGRPIGEPVVQHGPFVMNTRGEIQQAFADYQRTRFGGWPWGKDDPVSPVDAGRFARLPDGRVVKPT